MSRIPHGARTFPPLQLFALDSRLGSAVAGELGVQLSPWEERQFEDGEHKSRSLTSVRGADVFIVESLYSDGKLSVNDKLCRLLFFIGSIRDASAARITLIAPYLCYARKDRRTKTRDPVTSRYVAMLLEAVGVDHVVTMDVHNLAAFQNAFRCTTDHLEARDLFVAHFVSQLDDTDVIVLSPDEGGLKRAHAFRQAFDRASGTESTLGFMEKLRSGGVVSGSTLSADVKGRTVLMIDDLVSTGTTLVRAARAARAAGARCVHAAATHGLFINGAPALFDEPSVESVVVTDTLPAFRVSIAHAAKLNCLHVAPLLARVVHAIHVGEPLSELQLR